MDIKIFLILFMVGLSVVTAYYDDYDEDDDYDYIPVRRHHYPRRHFSRYPLPPPYHRGYRSENYGVKVGAKGKYKVKGSAAGDGRVFGQKGGFKAAGVQEGEGETGMQWSKRKVDAGYKGASRGSGSAAGMADTYIGGGSGKVAASHDVVHEGGATWDDERR